MIFACCTLALAAQDAIRVNYKGAKPNIVDFAWAYISDMTSDPDECDQEAFNGVKAALKNYRSGLPQDDDVTFTVDQKNGYICYEWVYENTKVITEMCYWNEADGKHKLFAYSTWYYNNGKPGMGQYDGLIFYRYDNATKKMKMIDAPGFDVEYSNINYTLPRYGKDIIVNKWSDSGRKSQRTLKWTGRGFK